ncbi:MAG: DNA-3-methyladenine glycosylase I [Pseudomonadota bacterium]|jgi:3-methyladenine DNA glycosylase Tag
MHQDEASFHAAPWYHRIRCAWCGDDPLYQAYHDNEWGVPVHDDRLLFEFLILEGAQAGLSWLTIPRKRENYRRAFVGSTICYAFMQAVGMVNDHTMDCFRYHEMAT